VQSEDNLTKSYYVYFVSFYSDDLVLKYSSLTEVRMQLNHAASSKLISWIVGTQLQNTVYTYSKQ